MPPILGIYRKTILKTVLILLGAGLTGFIFRVQILEFLDFKKAAEQSTLPQEVTLDQVQSGNQTESADNSANNGNENVSIIGNNAQEVLGAATQKKSLPVELNLKVPFTPQAPNAVWGLPYDEACEEAAALMVHYFYQDKHFTKEIADREILKIVNFENTKYGFYKDTTASETARFIKDLWGYKKVRILPATVEAIKQELASGRPVLAPTAGRLLGNPNFRRPGPLYHMLVIKGYTKDGRFITNDAGTRKGANYIYDQKVLMNAIHDWNNGDVNDGKKIIIVIDPTR